jgi:hypothetical protein
MADELHSLGEELLDRHLVLQLLRGLSKKYDLMNALIKRTKPLPSFHVVQNNLELELDMETDQSGVPHGSSTRHLPLLAANSRSNTLPNCFFCAAAIISAHRWPSPSCCPACQHQQRNGNGDGGGLGFDNTFGTSTGSEGGTPAWPSFYNSWMGSITMWSMLAVGVPRWVCRGFT